MLEKQDHTTDLRPRYAFGLPDLLFYSQGNFISVYYYFKYYLLFYYYSASPSHYYHVYFINYENKLLLQRRYVIILFTNFISLSLLLLKDT